MDGERSTPPGVGDDLAHAVRLLEQRVADLERRLEQIADTRTIEPWSASARPADFRRRDEYEFVTLLGVAGQGLIALAGAYLLRASTDQAIVPPAWGYLAGAGYGSAWFALAYRSGNAGSAVRAAVRTVVGCLVLFPLIWEATTRTHLIGPWAAALATAGCAAGVLAVSARVRLQVLAWCAVTFALPMLVAFAPATDRVAPFGLAAVLLGAYTLWISDARGWHITRWPVALVANVLVAGAAFRVAQGHDIEPSVYALGLLTLLPVIYFAGTALHRTLDWFEMIQSVCAGAVGISGALAVLPRESAWIVGALATTAGVVQYAVAWRRSREKDSARALQARAWLGAALILIGLPLVTGGVAGMLLEIGVALACVAVAAAVDAGWLVAQSAAYATAAAARAGLLTMVSARLVTGTADGPWSLDVSALLALSGVALVLTLVPRRNAPVSSALERAGRLILLVLATTGVMAVGVDVGIRVWRDFGVAVAAGQLATVRTLTLCATIVVLAWAAGLWPPEAGWVANALLCLGALKLVIEDLPRSRPSTLFLAMAAYGGALVLGPRLVRRRRVRPIESAPPVAA